MSAQAVEMVEKALAEKETEIKSKVGNLVVERDELMKALKKLTRGSNTASGPSVSDDEVIKAVGSLTSAPGSSPVKTSEIAKNLGVDARTIARRLAKFAEGGLISGNKDDGYSA